MHLRFPWQSVVAFLHSFSIQTCVDGFANGHVRTGVGFPRIRLACESTRIANPLHRCRLPILCPHHVGSAYGRAIRTISRRLGNHCRIRANPLGLRIHANCESASQIQTACTSVGTPRELTGCPACFGTGTHPIIRNPLNKKSTRHSGLRIAANSCE